MFHGDTGKTIELLTTLYSEVEISRQWLWINHSLRQRNSEDTLLKYRLFIPLLFIRKNDKYIRMEEAANAFSNRSDHKPLLIFKQNYSDGACCIALIHCCIFFTWMKALSPWRLLDSCVGLFLFSSLCLFN